jgi:DNA primase
MSVIDEIKSRVDIVDLVSESVKLRHSGKNYTGFCPFHQNTRTPAFVIFPDSGTWRCFGECNEGGDIFQYVMKKEGWDFQQALKNLAQRAGVELEPVTPEKKVQQDYYERLHEVLETASDFFQYHLLKNPAGAPALSYLLEKRGVSEETIQAFGLGYAPNAWQECIDHLLSKGYSRQEMLDVGLVSERRGGDGVYDRFRHRVMFPIRDASGKMVGFGARKLNPDDEPKFLNSPQTDLFDKSKLLYGLDQARKAIRSQDQVVIVEGYMDVIIPHQAGFKNTVSPMGTALTEEQLRQLKRYTRRIVLALDADAAGEKGTMRGLDIARQSLDRSEDIVFDPRGLIRYESRLSADLRVTTLPEGVDPDEIILENPQQWEQIIAAAKPVVLHVMESLTKDQDLDDPKVKSSIVEQMLPLIADVDNVIEREDYRQRLARKLKLDERTFITSVGDKNTGPSRRKRQPPISQQINTTGKPQQATQKRLADELEQFALCLLLRQPEVIYSLDRNLQELGLAAINKHDFDQMLSRELFGIIQNSLAQNEIEADAYIEDNISETMKAFYAELKLPMSQGEPSGEKLLEVLEKTMIRLRLARIQDHHEQLYHLMLDLQEQKDPNVRTYFEMVAQNRQLREKLDAALKKA